MTTFNIQNQSAEVVNNVGGDMFVGEQRVVVHWRPAEVRAELTRLASELERLELPEPTRVEARRLLGEATAESRDGGDPTTVASRLEKLTHMVSRAGAAARAGVGAIEALAGAAAALGPAGHVLAALVAAL